MKRASKIPTARIARMQWTQETRKQLLKRDGPCCFYCDHRFTEEFPPTLEHLLPVSAGGRDNVANVVLACGDCNKKVGSWPLIKKIKYREFKRKTKL